MPTRSSACRPERRGYDVHAHLVDQTCGKHLATDVASGDPDHRSHIAGRLDAADLPALSEAAGKLLATLDVRPVSDWRDQARPCLG